MLHNISWPTPTALPLVLCRPCGMRHISPGGRAAVALRRACTRRAGGVLLSSLGGSPGERFRECQRHGMMWQEVGQGPTVLVWLAGSSTRKSFEKPTKNEERQSEQVAFFIIGE